MALICIDFDKTISSKHIFQIIAAAIMKDPALKDDLNRQWELVKSVAPIRSEKFVWQQVFQQLLKDGHEIAIVSFSNYRQIIHRYLAEVVGLKSQELNKIVLVAKMPPNPKTADKSVHITLAKHFTIGANADNHDIALVDDDPNNLFPAVANKHHTILATADGAHLDALIALSSTLKKLPTVSSNTHAVNVPQLTSFKHIIAENTSSTTSKDLQPLLSTSSANPVKSKSIPMRHSPLLFKQSTPLPTSPVRTTVDSAHSPSIFSPPKILKETPPDACPVVVRENNVAVAQFQVVIPTISPSKLKRRNLASSAPTEIAPPDRLLKCSA